MLLTSGFVQVDRQALRDIYKLIDDQAKTGRGQRPNRTNARMVVVTIAMNTGYTTTPDGRMEAGLWRTSHREIAEQTGLKLGEVKSTLKFLKRVTQPDTQLGNDPLMLLEIQTLTENQYTNSAGLIQLELGKSSQLSRSGIVIKPLFFQRLTNEPKVNSAGVNSSTQPVIKNKSSQKIKKRVPRFSADLVPCTTENGSEPFNVKVKSRLVKDDTHEHLASSSKLSSRPDRVMQIPTGKTAHVGALVEKQKRAAERTEQGKPNLTAKRGGIAFDDAKQQYPELNNPQYLTWLNKLGVTFFPTHLETFKTLIAKTKTDPITNRNPIYEKLREAEKHRLKFDTVKKFMDHMQNPVVAAPIEFKMQVNELPF
jgi:hypothetical protein